MERANKVKLINPLPCRELWRSGENADGWGRVVWKADDKKGYSQQVQILANHGWGWGIDNNKVVGLYKRGVKQAEAVKDLGLIPKQPCPVFEN